MVAFDIPVAASSAPALAAASLIGRFAAADARVAVTFAGQGAEALPGLVTLVDRRPELADRVQEAESVLRALVESTDGRASGRFRHGYDLAAWVSDPGAAPPAAYLRSCAVSCPLILVSQLLAWEELWHLGLDAAVDAGSVVAVTGHSQGLLAALAVAESPTGPVHGQRLARHVTLAFHQGLRQSAWSRAGSEYSHDSQGGQGRTQMVSVRGQAGEVEAKVSEVTRRFEGGQPLTVGLVNSPEHIVVIGTEAAIEVLEAHLDAREMAHTRLPVDVPFHSPLLEEAQARQQAWLESWSGPEPMEDLALPLVWPGGEHQPGKAQLAERLAASQFAGQVRWDQTVAALAESGADWVLDLGPGTDVAQLTSRNLRGTGVRTLALGSPDGLRVLTVPAAAPSGPDLQYRDFAPGLVAIDIGGDGDGEAAGCTEPVVDNRYVRVTGQPPVILPGMTPTTADVPIVAAAANAGFTAELAGGGQPTEPILTERLMELGEQLEAGAGVVFNTLFLDRRLWQLHIGDPVGTGLLFQAKRDGAPLVGLTVSAGVPEVGEAVTLLDTLVAHGLVHNGFKPGTTQQVKQVLAIADAAPAHTIFVHLEGGAAGGHHSRESLEELLLANYHELRQRANLVLCVGGGVGTPERGAELLTGQWSSRHGGPAMPVDAVLVGTAAMACREASASSQVKELLAGTPGDAGVLRRGESAGGVVSGLSTLNADIHTVDNAAARAAGLLDEVAGNPEAMASRRDEIVEALARTAKPYFGDLHDQPYLEVLQRFTELCAIGRHGRYEDGPWLDGSWRERALALYLRWAARLAPVDIGDIVPAVAQLADLDDPAKALERFDAAYPDARHLLLHPADAAYFVEVCDRPGKPVPFVAALDRDVRRRFMADGLWQAQDPRYPADAVFVIPGPEAVGGIRRPDEPVADLLARFHQAGIDALQADGDVPVAARDRLTSRSLAPAPLGEVVYSRSGPLAAHIATPLPPSPLWRLVRPGDDVSVDVTDDGGLTRLELTPRGSSDELVVAEVTADGEVNIGVVLPGERRSSPLETVFTPGALVCPANARRSVQAYNAVTGAAHDGDPLDWAFTVAWPSLVQLLDQPSLVALLPSLVHHRHRVVAGPVWPPPTAAEHGDRESVSVRAEVTGWSINEAGLAVDIATAICPADPDPDAVGEHPEGRTYAVIETGLLFQGVTLPPEALSDVGEPWLPNGAGALARESAAAGQRQERAWKPLASAEDRAPADMASFALVGGDHNPLHRSVLAARLAGLEEPIVHGMWTSARAQAFTVDLVCDGEAARLREWSIQFTAPVPVGAAIRLDAARVGVQDGRMAVEVVVWDVSGDGVPGDNGAHEDEGVIVARATALVAPARTALVFPGQGVQRAGLGADGRGRSRCAREVWERADVVTRDRFGFSLLYVIDSDPARLFLGTLGDVAHPAGVVHRTEITQAALVTLAAAQLAELQDLGALPVDLTETGVVVAGHSAGELGALLALGVLSLEDAVELAVRRGLAMQSVVPRDARGASGYGLAAVDPSAAGTAQPQLEELVRDIAREHGELAQVVNYNAAGRQYVVAGTDRTLQALAGRLPAAVQPLSGIDVPFHSSVLQPAAAEFRAVLEEVVGPVDHRKLHDRWVPCLTGEPFRVAVGDPARTGRQERDAQARAQLIDVLARQVAAPVRWADVQRTLRSSRSEGGLGIRRQIEVGPSHAPVLTNLARLGGTSSSQVDLLHAEGDRDRVLNADLPPKDEENDADEGEDVGRGATVEAQPGDDQSPAGLPAIGTGPTEDHPFTAAEAIRLLLAVQAHVRPEQLDDGETLDDLFKGASSRRNQVLIDLGRELGVQDADGVITLPLSRVTEEVASRAPRYRHPGPYLRDAVRTGVTRALHGAGLSRADVRRHLETRWHLGPGLVDRVLATLMLESRPGSSARGGKLGRWAECLPQDTPAGRDLLDEAVQAMAGDLGLTLQPVAGGGSSSPGANGADDGHNGRERLGDPVEEPTGELVSLAQQAPDGPEARLAALERELGPDRWSSVQGRFDAQRQVRFSSPATAARWDLVALYHDALARRRSPVALVDEARRLARHRSDQQVAATTRWYSRRARDRSREDVAALMGRVLEGGAQPALDFSDETALVTGASPGSLGVALVAELLQGGATVVVPTSTFTLERKRWYRELYRQEACPGAALHVVPANLASFADIDALLSWLTDDGGSPGLPTLVAPFAAIPTGGDASEAGAASEAAIRLQLLGVERLVAGMGKQAGRLGRPEPVRVLLPLSPNHGSIGGDGPYSESKAALEVLLQRDRSEAEAWGRHVRLVGTRIGWVRGTGLMRHNDELAPVAQRELGIRTFSAGEMGRLLAEVCVRPGESGQVHDLTGGLGQVPAGRWLEILPPPATNASVGSAAPVTEGVTVPALPGPNVGALAPGSPNPSPDQPDGTLALSPELGPAEMVVIVGAAELGPCGTALSRFALELGEPLPPQAVLELAWLCGLVRFERSGSAGRWIDSASGEPVDEAGLAERYRDEVLGRVGVRPLVSDGVVEPDGALALTEVPLSQDVTFDVASEDEARSYVAADPHRTEVRRDPATGQLRVTRRAGATVRVSRQVPPSCRLAGQFPDGMDLSLFGLPGDLLVSADRMALVNLVCTAEAFREAGLQPEELVGHMHPAVIANTQGAGMGGLGSTRRLFLDQLLDGERQSDRLQEALGNVMAAHTVQSYVGSYGPMVHPVAACATAAVSLEEAWDKIRVGKALVAVAGGYDDLTPEGMVGFADMGATAASDRLDAAGIEPAEASRPNDVRRTGFVESQGGGALLVVRGDVALELGLPVRGVLAYAGSFGDGIQASIPAPGQGLLAAARGGAGSPLAAALRQHGLTADDIAVVSKHDTSTSFNDPSEARLHQRLQEALGRTAGNPLLVISQKSVTGHAKGGAAAWQVSGVLDVLESRAVPGNRNLDDLDPEVRSCPHLAHGTCRIDGAAEDPPRAALVTSLGFGHVSALLAVAHPDVFLAAVPEEQRADYLARAVERRSLGEQARLAQRVGEVPELRRPTRFPSPEAEAAMLLGSQGVD